MPRWRAADMRWVWLGLVALCGCPSEGGAGATGSASATPATTSTATATASASASDAPPDAPYPAPTTPPYTGPSGTLKGVVKVTGDPPPLTHLKYPEGCEAAAGTYGKLFRVGQDGQLADAIVMVTDYDKVYVPPKQEAIRVEIKNCAYDTRSIVMTDGQYLEVFNLDGMRKYIPHLDGARLPVARVAVPRGEGIKVYSRGPQRYWLRDQMGRDFMVAHVFHLPYATADTTGLDGRYEISGIPVGKAKVTVMLPQTKNLKAVSQEIEIKEGDNVLDLEFPFDAKADTPDDGHGNTPPPR